MTDLKGFAGVQKLKKMVNREKDLFNLINGIKNVSL